MLNQFRATNIVWDKASLKLYAAIRASSSDENGRKLVVQVINKGVTENLENTSLSLYWETQDGENRGLDPFEPLDPENGIYELYFRTGMLKHVGKLNAHLHLVDTTGAITSEPFTIVVFKGVDVDAMASDDELSALNKALIEVQNIKQDEAERVSAETERATAEEERKTAETARATAETTRNTNETTRVSNETNRVDAEDTRNTNEMNRVDAESGRVTAETARVTAEEEREQGYPALDGRITAVEQDYESLLAGGEVYDSTLINGWTGSLKASVNDMKQLHIWGAVNPGVTDIGTDITEQLPSIYRTSSGVATIPIPTHTANGGLTGFAYVGGRLRIYAPASSSVGTSSVRIDHIIQLI